MNKKLLLTILLITCLNGFSQEPALPTGFQQHTLTHFNSSLLNPAFSLDRNNPQSLSLWTRWQWQKIDGEPTSLFANYTRKIGEKSAIGVGFFQHTTASYFNTGGSLNYAYKFEFNEKMSLALGVNLFAFSQKLGTPITLPDGTEAGDDFILQVAPGINFKYDRFSLGLASENVYENNFSNDAANNVDKDIAFAGTLSYDLPVIGQDPTAFLRPTVYYKTIPEQDGQYGISALLSTQKYWGQAGYNSFYGISLGVGGTFFKRFSLGALVEYGSIEEGSTKEYSYELLASIFLGKSENRREEIAEMVNPLEDQDEETVAEDQETEEAKNEKIKEELEAAQQIDKEEQENKMAAEEMLKDKIESDKELENAKKEIETEQVLIENVEKPTSRQVQDSINQVEKAMRAQREIERRQQAQAERAESKAKKQDIKEEKYEEVANTEGLQPGYYLIANVFATKKYLNLFRRDLKAIGLESFTFYRSSTNYNYVYLERYNTLEEARNARENNFNGRYKGDTWIFNVVKD